MVWCIFAYQNKFLINLIQDTLKIIPSQKVIPFLISYISDELHNTILIHTTDIKIKSPLFCLQMSEEE